MTKIQSLRLFSILGALVVGFWLPLRLIGFATSLWTEVAFYILIFLISSNNIFLHFYDKQKNPFELKSWLRLTLLFDLVCLLPVSLCSYLWAPSMFNAVLIINLLSVRHINNIRKFLDYFASLQPIFYRLIPLFVTLPLLVHGFSCIWIFLGSGNAGNEGEPVHIYVRAVYWALTTLTTVGYGDISAKTIPQMLFCCVTEVTGVGVFGFILSNVAGLLARSDAAREHHMDSMDKIETFMQLHRTPTELRQKVRNYYNYMWKNKRGYRDDSMLNELPQTIQSELILHINRPVIEKVAFLRGADPEFIVALMGKLKARVFVPGEKIFHCGDPGDALYLIQNGQIDILTDTGDHVAALGEGSVFGEMALISDRPRTATARASSFCDLYILYRSEFDDVIHKYPSFRQHLEKVVAEREAA